MEAPEAKPGGAPVGRHKPMLRWHRGAVELVISVPCAFCSERNAGLKPHKLLELRA